MILCVRVQLWVCYMKMVQRRSDAGCVNLNLNHFLLRKKTSDYLKNPSPYYLYWLQRRLKTIRYTHSHGKSNIFHKWLPRSVWLGLKLSQQRPDHATICNIPSGIVYHKCWFGQEHALSKHSALCQREQLPRRGKTFAQFSQLIVKHHH